MLESMARRAPSSALRLEVAPPFYVARAGIVVPHPETPPVSIRCEAQMFDPTTDVPTLSLVIPVYNAADQLPATLRVVDSFAAHFPDRLEVLFVDDCSSEVETQLL